MVEVGLTPIFSWLKNEVKRSDFTVVNDSLVPVNLRVKQVGSERRHHCVLGCQDFLVGSLVLYYVGD